MKVLDHGSLTIVDHMGSDLTPVNCARISFDRESMVYEARDHKLGRRLLTDRHKSPFYHPQAMFKVSAPISVQRQWLKHKIGTAENSESSRYTQMERKFYIPQTFKKQSQTNKQGGDEEFSDMTQGIVRHWYETACNTAFDQYEIMVRAGVAREDAREVLPLCTYTKWIETMSLAAIFNFLDLRDDDHAQHTIREYAKVMRTLVKEYFPQVMDLYEESRTMERRVWAFWKEHHQPVQYPATHGTVEPLSPFPVDTMTQVPLPNLPHTGQRPAQGVPIPNGPVAKEPGSGVPPKPRANAK